MSKNSSNDINQNELDNHNDSLENKEQELESNGQDLHEEIDANQNENNQENMHQEPEKTVQKVHSEPKKSGNKLSVLACVLGLLGIGGAGYNYYMSDMSPSQNQEALLIENKVKEINELLETQAALKNSLSSLEKEIEALKTEDKNMNDIVSKNDAIYSKLDSATAEINAVKEQIDTLNDSLNSIGTIAKNSEASSTKLETKITETFLDVNEKINALNTLEEHIKATSDLNLLNISQADYLLNLAHYELIFERNIQSTKQTLEEAVNVLTKLNNRYFIETIARVRTKIEELEKYTPVDYEQHSLSLLKLTQLIPSITMQSEDVIDTLEKNFVENAANKNENPNLPWYKNAAHKLAPLFLVRKERADEPILLQNEDITLIKQSVQLELSIARLSLLQNQAESYQTSLKEAKRLISAYFSENDEQYHIAIAEINKLLNIDIREPDIEIDSIIKSFNAANRLYKGETL